MNEAGPEQERDQERELEALIEISRRGRAKLELGLARGRKQFDKRARIAERDSERRIQRAVRRRVR